MAASMTDILDAPAISPDATAGALQRTHSREPFLFGFGRAVREIADHRELLALLVRKELKVKYKDSVLGFMWTLIRPLIQLLVYSVAIGTFLGSGKAIPEFGLYLFTGLLVWQLFTDILSGATASIVVNSGLVKKVYLPRELFPLASVGAAFINFLLQSIVLLGAYVVVLHGPDWSALPLVLLALLVCLTFATALGLLLAATNVYLRDVQYLVEVGLLVWFWMTPIVYDWTKVRTQAVNHHVIWLFDLYLANPMADVVLAFQRVLWPGGRTAKGRPFVFEGDLALRLTVVLAVCVFLVWLAQRIFARAQGNFAQEL